MIGKIKLNFPVSSSLVVNFNLLKNKQVLISFAISVFICANPLSWALSFIPNILAILVIISLMICLMVSGKDYIRSNIVLIISISIYSLFYFQLLLGNITDIYIEYLTYFGILGVVGMSLASFNYSIDYVYKFISIISFLLIPVILTINYGDPNVESVDYGLWMGVSYGILRFLINSIICLFFYKGKFNKFKIINLISLFVYLYVYLNYASRGAIVSLFLFILIAIMIKKIRNNMHLIRVATIIGLIISLLYFNFIKILTLVNGVLYSLGVHVYFVDKIIRMYVVDGDLSNGRKDIADHALKGFVDSPIWGNGVGIFENQFDGYTHNLFTQVAFEWGIIGLIPLLILIFVIFKRIFSNYENVNERLFLLFLVSISLFELFFSSTYWRTQVFWLLIGIVLINKKRKCYEEKNVVYC